MELTWKFTFLLFLLIFLKTKAQENKPGSRIKKQLKDYTSADYLRLEEQWEEDDDPLEMDELPEHLLPQPQIDLSKLDKMDPDNILRVSKKGKSLMMFVDVKEEISEAEAETKLGIWQSSLQNAHIIAERYPIDKRRAIFKFKDGSQAVDAKNFLVEQFECSHVTLEGQHHIGRYATDTIKKKLASMDSRTKHTEL